MRWLVTPLAALALAGSLTAALAEEKSGKLTKIDLPGDKILVEDVEIRIYGVSIDGVKVGDNVKAEYSIGDEGNFLQKITKL